MATVVMTVVTFGFALTAIPISGANCAGDCIAYPYLDTAAQFPRDFLWMPLAIILMLTYVALMVSIHSVAPREKLVFSQVGLAFALIAATVLVTDYYLQFAVVPVSLMHNETDGLPLLIQYNSHGVFIALEELGYLVMSLSFLFMAPVFAHRNRLETAVQWLFVVSSVLSFAVLAVFSAIYGLDRQERFEVVIISINWLVLIVAGVLLSIVFRRRLST
jgi:hypothetical protein